MEYSKTTRFSTALLATLVMASSLSTSAITPYESSCPPSLISKVAKVLTVSFLAGCLIRLNTKEPDTKPVRYNLDELMAGQNVKENLLYVLDDGVIGQYIKKPYVTVDPDNARVTVSTFAPPKGIMGWFAFYYKGVLTGAGMTWFIYTLAQTICDPNVSPENLIATFAKKVEAQGKVMGFPKWSELALPIFVGAAAHASLSSN
jgi:hypothetical protein